MTLDILAEPLLELVVGVEQGRHHKVEQGPELCHRVLDRGPGQQKATPTLELQQHFPALTVGRLDGLGLVEDHVLPGVLVEVL